MEDKIKEYLVSDAMIQKPIEFSIDVIETKLVKKVKEERRFKFGIFPYTHKEEYEVEEQILSKKEYKVFSPTLGKQQLLAKAFLKLDLDLNFFDEDPATALFKCCSDHTDVMAEIMAISVFHKKDDLLNTNLIQETAEFFKWHCNAQDFSIIVGSILAQIDLSNFSNSIRLTRLFRINAPKKRNGGANRVEKSAAALSGEA